MNIRGKEVDFKISRSRDARAIQEAVEEFSEAAKEFDAYVKQAQNKNLVDLIERKIKLIREFFLTAIGEDVLADCDDAQEAQETYLKFLDDVNAQSREVRANVLYPVK